MSKFPVLWSESEPLNHYVSIRLQPADPNLSPTLGEDVSRSKANKQVLLEGAAAFNTKPKVGIKYLEEHGVITKEPASLANFLKTTPKLDKKLLGDFITRPDQLEVLKSFMQSMDFSGVSHTISIRAFRFG